MQSEFLLLRETKKNLEFGHITNSSFRPHFHSHIEIYAVKSGQLEVFINNERQVLKAGELSVAFSYDVHAYNKQKDAEVYFLIIPTSFCGDFLQLVSDKYISSPFINDKKTFETVLYSLENMTQEKFYLNDISKQGYVYTVLGAILSLMSPQKMPEAQNSMLSSDILIYISNHFKEDLSLSALAAAFGYNPSYLSRSFHKTFGISFNEYVKMLRLREAILLLNKNDFSITDCAFESGFGSTRSFYRAFSEEFGCSPKEYLKLEKE
ncbi:MAG: helix-turn-helix domain-containing protein [Ruminococcaceae bacterium]|nr:helix-turn-helix domain-containing protein [Oscillospiraceae bacterium]